MEIDEKDRKILSELDRNSRFSDSQISKKVGASKQVVNYRIKQLEKKEIISSFYTLIDVGKIGLNSHYVFMQLEGLNKLEESLLIERIGRKDYVGWLVSGTGRWDVVLLVYAKSFSEFDYLLNDIFELCKDHVHEHLFTSMISGEHLSYGFVGSKRDRIGSQKEGQNPVKLDAVDKRILREISQRARENLVEVSEKTRVPVHVVNYRLKRLQKEGVIRGFKPKINISKLGYQWYLLLLQFQPGNMARKKSFIDFCVHHKNVYYFTNTSGLYNIMLDLHVKDTQEFKEILGELKEKFPDIIKLYESMVIFEEHKIDYFPEELLNK